MGFSASRPPNINSLLADALMCAATPPRNSLLDVVPRDVIARALQAARPAQPPERRKPTDAEIEFAWSRGHHIDGYDPSLWRLDDDGRVMDRTEYGKTTNYGWEVDHIVPHSLGGADIYLNMRARHYVGSRRDGGLLSGT